MSYALHPMSGLGQGTPSAALQETVNQTAAAVAGTIAGGVIGLGVGVIGLGFLTYYIFAGHKGSRVRRNRRRSR